jgi:hypothetical protein
VPINFLERRNPFTAIFAMKTDAGTVRNEPVLELVVAAVEICCAIYASKIWHVVRSGATTQHIFGCIWFFARHSVKELSDTFNCAAVWAFLRHI